MPDDAAIRSGPTQGHEDAGAVTRLPGRVRQVGTGQEVGNPGLGGDPLDGARPIRAGAGPERRGLRIASDGPTAPVRLDGADLARGHPQTRAPQPQQGLHLLIRGHGLTGKIDQGLQVLGVAHQRRLELTASRGRGLKLGDVLDHAEHEGAPAGCARQQHYPQIAPDEGAVGLEKALGEPIGVALARDQLLEEPQILLKILGIGQGIESHADEVLWRVAEEVGQHAVDQGQSSVGPYHRDPDRGIFEDSAQPGLALPELLPRAMAFGHIDIGAPIAQQGTVLGQDREAVGEDPDGPAIAAHEGIDVILERVPTLEAVKNLGLKPGAHQGG